MPNYFLQYVVALTNAENGKHRHERRDAAGRYFLRYQASGEQVARDLREKRSYVGYLSFATMGEAVTWAEGVNLSRIAALAVECSDGRYRFALPGLCGFAYRSVEDARADAIKNQSFETVARWPLAAIFTGRKVGETDDADLFLPDALACVVPFERAADAITGETHLPAIGKLLSDAQTAAALMALMAQYAQRTA